MRQDLADMEAIANRADAPTFDNTILAMERSGMLLTRVTNVFDALNSANTNPTLQKVDEAESPRRAAHYDEIYLNPKLFARVKSIYDRRTTLGLDSTQQYLVERYYKNFVRAGALLSDGDKTRLRALNEEESKLTSQFHNRLLAATKAGALVIDNPADLDGLSEGELANAAAAAKDRGLTGKWVIPLQNTTQHPEQPSLRNRATRQRLFLASTQRAEHSDSNDTRAVVTRLAQLRAEKAQLLGYPTYAAYRLENQ